MASICRRLILGRMRSNDLSCSFGPRAPALSEVEGSSSLRIMSELEARGPEEYEAMCFSEH